MILKTKNIIIRLFILSTLCFLLVEINQSSADYEGFLSKLREINIPVDKLSDSKGLPRYELTRLLNTVECKDCVNPSPEFVNKYNLEFWSNFKLIAGNNFNDIGYLGGEWNKDNYYYCVAYVGDNEYMNGYPNTSPVCAGNFCGNYTVNKAEFVQVIINLISNYIYTDISTNWEKMKLWLNKLPKDEYQYKTFNTEDIKIINDSANKCDNTCKLKNGSEVKVYLKYCMFNLAECGMEPVGKLGQGYRPVAELNLLKDQNILQLDQDYWSDIGGNMDVKKILEVMYNLNTKIDCDFEPDYDCDGILNAKDNCPSAYNPSQKDYDRDSIGDVCDNDIDNDGIKNPIGIVDESGKINIRLWADNIDNCLFLKNADQKDDNKNGIGDACENIDQGYLSMYIFVDNFTGTAPLSVSFKAVTEGTYKDIEWRFSDGYTSKGENIQHTFEKAGIYNVNAIGKGKNNDAYASTTIIVGNNPNEINGIGVISQKIGGKAPFETDLSVSYIGKYDWISRNFGDKEIIENQDRSFKKLFMDEGIQTITIKAMKDDKIKGVSQFNIGVGDKYPGSNLKTSVLDPEIGKDVIVNTEYINFSAKDVSYVVWDRGDGKTEKNTSLINNHSYDIDGQKVIIQKITLKNGVIMTNMITIFVLEKSEFNSNAIMMLPSSLENKLGGKVGFDIKIIGSKIESYINLIFQYLPGISDLISGYKSKNYFEYSLVNKGLLYPSARVNINQCNYLKTDMTIYVKGYDFCLSKKLDGTLKNYKCDMDKDSIPDICDDDIDGDGVKNLLGLINYENSNCSIPRLNPDDKNYTKQINVDVLKQHFQGICSLDNAPFVINSNQEDLNIDGIGDVIGDKISGNAERFSMFVGDSDGDGIPDYKDKCVNIQETYNGINDEDGCPEVGSDLSCSKSSFCGNGVIDTNETCDNCPIDIGFCNTLSDNIGNNGDNTVCGNGKIESGETCDNCPSDVGICEETGKYCGDKIISDNEFCRNCANDVGSCTSNCGNGKIELGENCNNCPQDVKKCGTCGNGIKDPDESCISCPSDYGICKDIPKCGNGKVDPGETCNTCPADVRKCYEGGDVTGTDNKCGNGKVDPGETCNSCPSDIGICEEGGDNKDNTKCGNGVADPGESCISCPSDIGICGEELQISNENCMQCPCPYSANDGDIKNGYKVRAVLWSQKMIIPYISSAPWTVDF